MKNFLILLMVISTSMLILSCRELDGTTLSGTATLSSSLGCGDASVPIGPPPAIPSSLPSGTFESFSAKYQKRGITEFQAGENFVVLIDLKCSESQKNNGLSQKILSLKKSSSIPKVSRYAVNWKLDKGVSTKQLGALVDADSCILAMDKDLDNKFYFVSNDEFYGDLSFFETLNAEAAHDIFYNDTTGINSSVVVAIIDSGVQSDHPDLVNQLWVNGAEIPGNGLDDDGNGYDDDINGYNFGADTGAIDPLDTNSHGTHVAGLAAAEADNGIGVAGVMGFHVEIMGLNVSDSAGNPSSAGIINAIYYAAENGADVINLSLGAAGANDAYRVAMLDAVESGSTLFLAAGNDGIELTDSVFFSPASYGRAIEGAITVGSLDVATDAKSGFSNFSATYVEIMAPGSHTGFGGLYSTVLTSDYDHLQGTSMASPVTAGAGALAIGLIRSRGGNPTPADIENYLKNSATTNGSLDQCVESNKALDLLGLAQQINLDFP